MTIEEIIESSKEIKHILKARYKGIYKRCNFKNRRDYQDYGKLRVKCMLNGYKDLAEVLSLEYRSYAVNRGIKEFDEFDIVEFLKERSFDRIDGAFHYIKENLVLSTKLQNMFLTSNPAMHVRLTKDLYAPLCAFDLNLNSNSSLRTLAYTNFVKRKRNCNGYRLLKRKTYKDKNVHIGLIWFHFDEIPIKIHKTHSMCRCGRNDKFKLADYIADKDYICECGLHLNVDEKRIEMYEQFQKKMIDRKTFRDSMKYIKKYTYKVRKAS